VKITKDTAAVVTGGASGLGEASARAFAAAGVKVAIFDFNDAKPRDLRHGAFPMIPEGQKGISEEDPKAPMVRVPGIGWKEAGNQIEQRRLASAVGADQPEDATLAHRQVDVVGDDDAAETLAQ